MKLARSLQFAVSIGFVSMLASGAPSVLAGEDCECLGNGKRVKEGGVICLQIGSSQRYLARCERNLNNTSWKKISDGCPVANMSSPAASTAIPTPG